MQALTISQDLRLNGIMCEINSNNLSMKSQFKLADNLNAKFIIILNNEDLQKGLIKVRDNATKEEIMVDERELLDWIISNI
jgi:histidyl-tRNA synthetase